MKKTMLAAIAMTALLWAAHAQDKSASSKEPEYRSIDPEKDGFTVELSSGGSISWTAEGWMSSDSVTATAIGTTAGVKGAKLVLLDSGKCVNGKANTKDYGIIKMKSAGGFSADILMTQDSITKVRAALLKSVASPVAAPSQAVKESSTGTSDYVSSEGITIPDDAKGMPKGKFGGSAFAGQTVTISLAGKTVNALLKYSGNVQFTDDGMLARGTKKFNPVQIMTSKKNEVWIDISSFSIGKDGFLVVSDKSGATYKIKFGPNFNGAIEEIEKSSQDKK